MQSFAIGPGARFEMPDIMRSYQMAKNFGMNPQGGSLAAFADLAAGERVPLKQVLYAVKDAMEGTSVRPIANLGIKMKQGKGADGLNSYTYSNLAGKFVTATSAKNPEATLHALLAIINSKYAGLAAAQAKTVDGGIAQMKKVLYLFQMKVAASGLTDWLIKQMNTFLGWVHRASADGSLDKFASAISRFLTGVGDKIIGFVKATDWGAVGKDLAAFAAILGTLAGGFQLLANIGGGGISGLLNIFVASKIIGMTSALIGFAPAISGIATALVAFDIAALPLSAVIAIIGGLVAVGYLLWANWDKVWKAIPGIVSEAASTLAIVLSPVFALPKLIIDNWSSITGFFTRLWDGIVAIVRNAARRINAAMPWWMAAAMGPGGLMLKLGANLMSPTPSAPPMALPGQRTQAGGGNRRVDLHVHTDPGTRATVRNIQGNDLSVWSKPSRGPVLGAFR